MGVAPWGSFPSPAQGPDRRTTVRAGSGPGTPRWASSPPPSRSGVSGIWKFPGEGEAELSPDDGCLLLLRGWRRSLASSCFPSGPCHIPSLGGGQGEDTIPHLGTLQAPSPADSGSRKSSPASWPPPLVPHLPSHKNNVGATWGQCQEGLRKQNGTAPDGVALRTPPA